MSLSIQKYLKDLKLPQATGEREKDTRAWLTFENQVRAASLGGEALECFQVSVPQHNQVNGDEVPEQKLDVLGKGVTKGGAAAPPRQMTRNTGPEKLGPLLAEMSTNLVYILARSPKMIFLFFSSSFFFFSFLLFLLSAAWGACMTVDHGRQQSSSLATTPCASSRHVGHVMSVRARAPSHVCESVQSSTCDNCLN